MQRIFLRYTVLRVFVIIFFFQAEDGIRDVAVTRVQTCALPICERRIVFQLPGVRSASMENYPPLTGLGAATGVRIVGRPDAGHADLPVSGVRVVDRKSVV